MFIWSEDFASRREILANATIHHFPADVITHFSAHSRFVRANLADGKAGRLKEPRKTRCYIAARMDFFPRDAEFATTTMLAT